jgi:hypothetical protein
MKKLILLGAIVVAGLVAAFATTSVSKVLVPSAYAEPCSTPNC